MKKTVAVVYGGRSGEHEISHRSFLLADSSKFGRESLYKVFDLDNFDAVLTDTGTSPQVAAWFTVPVERHDARPKAGAAVR